MSKTSIIRHPSNANFLEIYEWQYKAVRQLSDDSFTEGERQTAVYLLNLFAFHLTNPYENQKVREIMDRALRSTTPVVIEWGDWLPYSMRYLTDCLFGVFSIKTIIPALKLLENIEFIDTENVPQDLLVILGNNHTWIKLNLDVIHEWIDQNYALASHSFRQARLGYLRKESTRKPKDDTDGDESGREVPELRDASAEYVKPPAKTVQDAVTEYLEHGKKAPTWAINKLTDAFCEYHRAVHGKTNRYIYDTKRESMPKNALKKGRTLGELAQMIVGNTKSAFHQGKNHNQIRYDDLSHIMQTIKRQDEHIAHAAKAGITEKMALNDFLAFLNTGTSRYATKPEKEPEIASIDEVKAIQEKIRHIPQPPAEIPANYRTFARVVSPYIAAGMPNQGVLTKCLSDVNLLELGINIQDQWLLYHALRNALESYGTINSSMEENLLEFAEMFTNKEKEENAE